MAPVPTLLNGRGDSRRRALFESLLVIWLGVAAAAAQAQAPAPPGALPPCPSPLDLLSPALKGQAGDIQTQLEVETLLRTTADNGPANSGAVSFVESATAVREWFLTFGTMSNTSGYQFPITFSANPFHILRDSRLKQCQPVSDLVKDGFARRLDQSELAVSYAPLVVQTKPDHTPGFVGSHSQKATFSFKMALLGTIALDDLNTAYGLKAKQDLDNLADDIPRLAQEPAGEAEIKRRNDAIAAKFIPGLKGDVARQFSLFMKGAYTADSQSGKPDFALAILTASKELGKEGTQRSKNPIILTGTLTHTWYSATSAAARFAANSVAGAASVGLTDVIFLSLQAGLDRYSGSGFAGIPGVTDHTRRTDFNLLQTFKFLLPFQTGKDKLEIGLKEQHLGTGNTDVALTIALTLAPRPKHPAPSGPSSAS
jgi:hypothetical protein